jgi:hypothetical protein
MTHMLFIKVERTSATGSVLHDLTDGAEQPDEPGTFIIRIVTSDRVQDLEFRHH